MKLFVCVVIRRAVKTRAVNSCFSDSGTHIALSILRRTSVEQTPLQIYICCFIEFQGSHENNSSTYDEL